MADNSREAVDLLISGADVVCLDEENTLAPNASVAIRGNRIHWIGEKAEAAQLFDSATTIDGSGMIAMPGLIDTHVHTAQHLLRGKIAEIARRERIKIPIWKNYYINVASQAEISGDRSGDHCRPALRGGQGDRAQEPTAGLEACGCHVDAGSLFRAQIKPG